MDEPTSPQRCRLCCAGLARPAGCPDLLAEPAAHLRGIVRRHLRISISPEDRLPRMICASCTSKLEGIHEFATMALKSQEKLKQELVRTSTDSAVTIDSSDSSDSTSNKLGDRGLLHSILTKGSTEASNDGESIQGRQRAPSTEEMEVKVDPMLFLQCALEQTSPVNNSEFSDDSDSDSDPAPNPQPLTKNSCRRKEKEHKMNKVKEKINDDDFRELNNIDESKDNETDGDEYFEESEDLPDDKLKSHICKICTRAFFTQIALQNHLWSHLPATANEIHNSDDKPSIPDVQEVFDSVNGVMAQNMTENNLLGGNFICPICGKKISTKGNLKVHLETHRPKGKYGCDICGRIFKTQSNLFRHKEYHSGIQFPCSVCGRVYPTNSTLRAHSITHSDLRPHACPLCDKTFKRNQDLKFHINQHTGARPYQCPYCPKAFASSGNCFSHRKRMHPKEVHRDRQRAADLMR